MDSINITWLIYHHAEILLEKNIFIKRPTQQSFISFLDALGKINEFLKVVKTDNLVSTPFLYWKNDTSIAAFSEILQ